MDSHLFDYNNFRNKEMEDYSQHWINECNELGGKAFLLWHPQTLTKGYGWYDGFMMLLRNISHL